MARAWLTESKRSDLLRGGILTFSTEVARTRCCHNIQQVGGPSTVNVPSSVDWRVTIAGANARWQWWEKQDKVEVGEGWFVNRFTMLFPAVYVVGNSIVYLLKVKIKSNKSIFKHPNIIQAIIVLHLHKQKSRDSFTIHSAHLIIIIMQYFPSTHFDICTLTSCRFFKIIYFPQMSCR